MSFKTFGDANETSSARKLHIKKARSSIILDGILDEEDWKLAEPTQHFYQIYPYDTSEAISNTVIKVTYDEENFYVGIISYDHDPGNYLIESYKRDFFGAQNDVVNIIIDPYADQTTAFLFGLSPYGVMREGLINAQDENGKDGFSWDNKWFAETKIYDDHWTGEMAIPFKTLRFREGVESWRLNFYRIDTKQNERSSWYKIPRGFKLSSLAFTGELIWDEPLKKNKGANISVIPYASAGYTQDFLTEKKGKFSREIGGDIKLGISPSLNLDLTVNPDFSNVDVDEQVANLSRFEIFFPEKRQFFLENADLFANFGTEQARPFFSRRIGIAYDSTLSQNIPNSILFGARLSGKLNKNLRIGLLTMQGARDSRINLPSQNYTVAVVQRTVFGSSNISAIFANKQPFFNDDALRQKNYNRAFGLEYNLNSTDGRWKGKAFYQQAFLLEKKNDQEAYGVNMEHTSGKVRGLVDLQHVGENFDAQVGYVPRKNIYRVASEWDYHFYPKSALLNRHSLKISAESFLDNLFKLTDRKINLGYEFYLMNNSRLNLSVIDNFTHFRNSFDPSNSGGEKLPAGSEFAYLSYEIVFHSDKRKTFFFELESTSGKYFNGRRTGFSGILNLKYSPLGIFSMNYSYNMLRMPAPYSDANLLLLGPSFEFTFSKNVFFNTLIQYNNQIDNLGVNARFQWRFKPVSDLFIVYNDNYFPENMQAKNRTIIAKLSYWFSL